MEYVRDVEDSKALNFLRDSAVIISASGMCEAGRILHHLKNNIENPANTILIVGYQAAHTLGRRLVEKRKQVELLAIGIGHDVTRYYKRSVTIMRISAGKSSASASRRR